MRGAKEIITKSVLTCPVCGHKKEEEMPVETCLYLYECENCKTLLKPRRGDCCVFCSYGTKKCPSACDTSHVTSQKSVVK